MWYIYTYINNAHFWWNFESYVQYGVDWSVKVQSKNSKTSKHIEKQ